MGYHSVPHPAASLCGGRSAGLNTLPILIATLCFLAIGYRYYSAFIASKALLPGPG